MTNNNETQIQNDNRLTATISRCRKGLFAITAFSFGINLLMLAAPLYMLQVFDRVLGGGSVETLTYLTLIVVIAFVAMACLEFLRSRMMISIGTWLERKLSDVTLERHINIAAATASGRNAQGLRDIAIIRNFLTGPTVFPMLDAPWMPVFLAVIFLLHPLLGFMAVGGAVMLILLALLNNWLTDEPMKNSSAYSITGLHNAETAVRHADTIVSMGFAGNLVQRWARTNEAALKDMAVASSRSGLVAALSKFSRLALQISMTGAGAWLVLGGELTAGGMIASSILLGKALGPADQAISFWKAAVAAKGAYQRLKALLSPIPVLDAEIMELPAPEGRVDVESLYYAHEGCESLLKNISFSLKAGESLGIAGPTAVGKTTLARLMVGLTHPQAGHVRLDSADMAQWPADTLGQHIGYLPQEVVLFEGTVRENIARFGDADAAQVVKAAQRAQVHDMILHLPQGYETQIGAGGAALSGGQRQRIALARALFGDPHLVILDEPNASLDFKGDAALIRSLKTLKDETITTVVITHRPSILRHVDRIMVLHADGHAETGARNDMLQKITEPENRKHLGMLREVKND
ncbi:type I secretion system permease/ATPase [Aestuariispira insulae]|uniref:ATP-binding cassette subfamily C protein/ATP-binding cassette subfamily C protein EexD n=1 Tax=Aestuariispira insulae TaxID=1461337 RepID=A0A3D9HR54_9PROT|nr:type I secretion system permease/ATPase [Aestuariispira insulae]RED52014.1 ATP-binding cassette subfamily C protein/ATP-binding cassette subfamily C protein EexD [Aestuariispira insulae]